MFLISRQPHITPYEPIMDGFTASTSQCLMVESPQRRAAPDDSDEIFAGFKEFFPLPGTGTECCSASVSAEAFDVGFFVNHFLWDICNIIERDSGIEWDVMGYNCGNYVMEYD